MVQRLVDSINLGNNIHVNGIFIRRTPGYTLQFSIKLPKYIKKITTTEYDEKEEFQFEVFTKYNGSIYVKVFSTHVYSTVYDSINAGFKLRNELFAALRLLKPVGYRHTKNNQVKQTIIYK